MASVRFPHLWQFVLSWIKRAAHILILYYISGHQMVVRTTAQRVQALKLSSNFYGFGTVATMSQLGANQIFTFSI
jgi:hypothetical protein